jgi:hypothetical protein
VETVKQASVELEKVINLFVRKVEDVQDEEHLHHNLDLSTLKYIVETDPCKVSGLLNKVRKTLRVVASPISHRARTRARRPSSRRSTSR